MVDGGRVRPGRRRRVGRPGPGRGAALPRCCSRARRAVERGTAAAGRRRARRGHQPAGAAARRADARPAATTTSPRRWPGRSRSRTGQPASFGGAARRCARCWRGARRSASAPGAVALVDGSGLSRDDRSSRPRSPGCSPAPRPATAAPALAPLLSGLPVAGFDGTLADRYRTGAGVPAAGRGPRQDRHAQRRQRPGRPRPHRRRAPARLRPHRRRACRSAPTGPPSARSTRLAAAAAPPAAAAGDDRGPAA